MFKPRQLEFNHRRAHEEVKGADLAQKKSYKQNVCSHYNMSCRVRNKNESHLAN